MDPVFSIGISSLWDELRHMPAGGVWWFNVDRHEDAISLANQTIASQAETAHVAVISMDSDPAKIFQLDDSQGPEKIKLFSMLNHEKGLYYLTRDLQCSIDPHNYLFILVCANNAWQNIPAERLRSWLDKMNKWSRLNHCSLLVINPGNNNDKQFSLLLEEYRSCRSMPDRRNKLSGQASTTRTFSPNICNDQANAAVMVVVPTPPRTPCYPSTAIHQSPTFVAQTLPATASVLMPRPTVRVGKYRHNQYQAVKMPALTPQYHSGRYSLSRDQAEYLVHCYSFCLIPMK